MLNCFHVYHRQNYIQNIITILIVRNTKGKIWYKNFIVKSVTFSHDSVFEKHKNLKIGLDKYNFILYNEYNKTRNKQFGGSCYVSLLLQPVRFSVHSGGLEWNVD